MAFTRAVAVAVAFAGTAVVSAGPAWADEQLNGDYTFINGPTMNTWTITTQCNPEGKCAGTLSTSTGLVAAIGKLPGGPWTVDRHDVPNGWRCPDGSTGRGDLSYSFDPASLAGTLSLTSKPGACNDPNVLRGQQPVSLRRR
jgi:hypothetical protein